MKRILGIDIKYSLSQVFYFASLCSMTGFASVYLLNKNFTNSDIGLVLALSNIIAVFLQPTLASFLDRHKEIDVRNVIKILVLIVISLSVLLLFFPLVGTALLITVVSIFSLAISIMPLTTTLAFIFENKGVEVNYGVARGIGSVAYALASLGLGYFVNYFSPKYLPVAYILFNGLLFLIVHLYVLPKNHTFEEVVVEKNESNNVVEQLSIGQFVMKYKKFMLFLVGIVLVFFSHNIINNFFIQVIKNVGGDAKEMGNAIFLAAMLELPTMAYFTKLNKKVNCATLIKVSIALFGLKHLLTYFASGMTMIYLAQACQMGAYALFIPASVYYVNNKIDVNDQVKGQSFVTTSFTLSGVISSFLGGRLLDAIGVKPVLLIGVILSFIGFLIILLSTEKVEG